eukprot:TRINITY_DN14124_c0_g1_i1.p1 TRINITY_DN14124_c0_g1~~TRINITY_DN14124_c0_g1_i1.p1  ORF type:complete len:306 (+),score=115.79 TRINITY_DN14124_c0_g1_i1:57-974(+)
MSANKKEDKKIIIRRKFLKISKEKDEKSASAKKNEVVEKKEKFTVPNDEEGKELYNVIKQFAEDENATFHEFPSNLSSDARKTVHAIAEEFGLLHYSRGTKVRFITLEKSNNTKEDEWQYFNYVGLFGPSVDAVVSDEQSRKLVPETSIKNKVKRDGPISHITVISPNEELIQALEGLKSRIDTFFTLMENQEERKKVEEKKRESEEEWIEILMDLTSQFVKDDWKDLGVGCVHQSKNKAWFKVIEWPSAKEFRRLLGLSDKDFHVTIGYVSFDIHGIPKDSTTLINSGKGEEVDSSVSKLNLKE